MDETLERLRHKLDELPEEEHEVQLSEEEKKMKEFLWRNCGTILLGMAFGLAETWQVVYRQPLLKNTSICFANH